LFVRGGVTAVRERERKKPPQPPNEKGKSGSHLCLEKGGEKCECVRAEKGKPTPRTGKKKKNGLRGEVISPQKEKATSWEKRKGASHKGPPHQKKVAVWGGGRMLKGKKTATPQGGNNEKGEGIKKNCGEAHGKKRGGSLRTPGRLTKTGATWKGGADPLEKKKGEKRTDKTGGVHVKGLVPRKKKGSNDKKPRNVGGEKGSRGGKWQRNLPEGNNGPRGGRRESQGGERNFLQHGAQVPKKEKVENMRKKKSPS